MTQEEKAKAYDEAIEKAKVMHEEGMMTERLEYLFPELVESEDDKIRKVLYGWVYTMPSSNFEGGFSREDMLAWLERQEQKPSWSEEDESILQGIWDEILANKHDAKEYEWKTYDKFLNWLNSLKNRVQPQPKQEWSEEDEAKLKSACALIRNTSLNGNEGVVDSTIDWLKSLKEKLRNKYEMDINI